MKNLEKIAQQAVNSLRLSAELTRRQQEKIAEFTQDLEAAKALTPSIQEKMASAGYSEEQQARVLEKLASHSGTLEVLQQAVNTINTLSTKAASSPATQLGGPAEPDNQRKGKAEKSASDLAWEEGLLS